MKQINETVTDKEHEFIMIAKSRSGLTWREWLISVAAKENRINFPEFMNNEAARVANNHENSDPIPKKTDV